ncbi:MAG: hypothetical protein IBX40_12290 [Methanosarcinales archaeon]|nr:hypothetical protein [Methanosarcinales archaeon]
MRDPPPATTHLSINPHFAPNARRNNRKAPATPHTTRAGGADRERHPGKVKARGAAGELKKEWSAGISSILTADGFCRDGINRIYRIRGSINIQ